MNEPFWTPPPESDPRPLGASSCWLLSHLDRALAILPSSRTRNRRAHPVLCGRWPFLRSPGSCLWGPCLCPLFGYICTFSLPCGEVDTYLIQHWVHDPQNNKRAYVCTSDLLRKVLESCSAYTPRACTWSHSTPTSSAKEAENMLLVLDGQAPSCKSWVLLMKRNAHIQIVRNSRSSCHEAKNIH